MLLISITYMLLKQIQDMMMITIVVSIPTAVVVPMSTKLASSADWLYIIQELHFGLQLIVSFTASS